MKQRKRSLAWLLAFALCMTLTQGKAWAASKTGYTISQKAGTYQKKVRVVLKAKKGYKVYYATNGTLTAKKVLTSGKKKAFIFRKTKTLTVYAVKQSKKITKKEWKKMKNGKKGTTYKYTIKKTVKKVTASPTGTVEASLTATPLTAQRALDEAELAAPVSKKEAATQEDATPVITLSVNSDGETAVTTENLTDSEAVSVEENVITITKAGTYVLSGGSEVTPAKNVRVQIDAQTSDDVNLILKDLHIDNSALGTSKAEDAPVIYAAKKTTKVTITLVGSSVLKGNGTYTSEPASGILYVKDSDAVLTLMASQQDEDASLEIVDSMAADTDFGTEGPSDGVASKGTVTIQSGIYKMKSNGDGIKGKTAVNLLGGEVTIESYGDGIQGESVWIGGEKTKLDITTKFINAGKNYYSTSLGSEANTMTKTDTTKKEVVKVDTGSHKGIKAGTKGCTYEYGSVAAGSTNEVGTVYEKQASGGLVITGGEIKIDTTNTGIKYNGSDVENGFFGSSLTPANNDGQYIIGAPDDAVHSNNTCVIAGGTLALASADDGLTSASTLLILNDTKITITKAYEGMEAGYIVIGKSSESQVAPEVSVYSDDDGVNAASKASIHYVYEDEDELAYTKTETSATDNDFYMLDGTLEVTISDDKTHTFSLPVSGQSDTTGSYTGDGDGIDCNGSFYGYGGKVTVYGTTRGDNSPIDTDKTYYIGKGITLLALGSSGMPAEPTMREQSVIRYGNSQQDGMGGFGPTGNPSTPGTAIAANALLSVTDSEDNTILSLTSPKSFSYFLYSSPELVAGNTYQIKTSATTLRSVTAE